MDLIKSKISLRFSIPIIRISHWRASEDFSKALNCVLEKKSIWDQHPALKHNWRIDVLLIWNNVDKNEEQTLTLNAYRVGNRFSNNGNWQWIEFLSCIVISSEIKCMNDEVIDKKFSLNGKLILKWREFGNRRWYGISPWLVEVFGWLCSRRRTGLSIQ